MIDTTHFKRTGGGKSVSNTVYLNDDFSELFEGSESSSIIFIHLNKKDAKAVLVGIPKNFDKNKLNYNYFTTQTCDFIIKAWS